LTQSQQWLREWPLVEVAAVASADFGADQGSFLGGVMA
jgi:hypothetical protein